MARAKKIKTLSEKDGPIAKLLKIKNATPKISEKALKFFGEEVIKLSKQYIKHKKNPYMYSDVPWKPLHPSTPLITYAMTGEERDSRLLPLLNTGDMAESLRIMAVGVYSNKAFVTIGSKHPGFNTHEYGGRSPVTGGPIPPRPSVHPAIEQLLHSRSFKSELRAKMAKAIKLAANDKSFNHLFETSEV